MKWLIPLVLGLLFPITALAQEDGERYPLDTKMEWSKFGYDPTQAWVIWKMTLSNRTFYEQRIEKLQEEDAMYGEMGMSSSHPYRIRLARDIEVWKGDLYEAKWYERIWDEFTFVPMNNMPESERNRHLWKMRELIGEKRWQEATLPIPEGMFLNPDFPYHPDVYFDWPYGCKKKKPK